VQRLLAALAMVVSLGAAWAQPRVHTDEPRPYGYVVGDVIERHIDIDLPAGRSLAPDALPHRGRVDVWLELRELGVRAEGEHLSLSLKYQLVNAPRQVTMIALPGLSLSLSDQSVVRVDEWPVTAGPLTPEFVLSRAGLTDLQPDMAPQPAPMAARWARTSLWAALFVLCTMLWAVQRYPQLAFWRRQALWRRAWLDLRRLARQHPTPAYVQWQALQRVHAAFDATAGCAVFADALQPLYAAGPWLRDADTDITAFFAASRRCAFAGPAQQPGSELTLPALMALCRRLAQLEAQR
jgi:mxaA protein